MDLSVESERRGSDLVSCLHLGGTIQLTLLTKRRPVFDGLQITPEEIANAMESIYHCTKDLCVYVVVTSRRSEMKTLRGDGPNKAGTRSLCVTIKHPTRLGPPLV